MGNAMEGKIPNSRETQPLQVLVSLKMSKIILLLAIPLEMAWPWCRRPPELAVRSKFVKGKPRRTGAGHISC